ncbi:hypothetical protein [Fluviispira sanaruensis]|uniref:SAM-dependent methyltransferase n=1 Tax=Fluviispira sanaruensis TaxID=2493639 RepID=A0A4P2VMW0_FLUSA|nr:hypothetical protein [Fluviispira sanaruensis]BBH54148.1 hypothetical protein JCM31447_26060 [Fluviispira sanaruensis]
MKTSLKMSDNLLNNNLSLWNNWAKINYKTAFYDIEGFKTKKNSLKEIELKELGCVHGKSLLHLQCHLGQDSISWAHLGAKVTGIDLS